MLFSRYPIAIGVTLAILQPSLVVAQDISAVNNIAKNLFLAATNFSSGSYELAYTIPDVFAVNSPNTSFFDTTFFESANPFLVAKPYFLEVAGNEVAIGENKIVSNNGNTVKVWNLATGELEQTLTGHSEIVKDIAVNSKQIVSISYGYDNTIKIWNLATGTLQRTINVPGTIIDNFDISEDKIIIAPYTLNLRKYTINLGNLTTGEIEQNLDAYSGSIISLAVDEDRIAIGSAGTSSTETIADIIGTDIIRVWDLATGILEKTFPDAAADVIAIGKDKVVSSGYYFTQDFKQVEDNTIKVWDLTAGKLEHTLTGHTDRVNSIAISNGKVISGSKDKTIKIWNLATGELEQTLTGHTDSVTSIAVDGNTIVSGSKDKTIKVWRTHPLGDLQTLSASQAMRRHGVRAKPCSPTGAK